MTDRAQFEAMLNALINEDQDAAKEIFHNIVVAKSREIYEELLAEDFNVSEGENPFAKDQGNPYDSEEEEEGEEEEEEGEEEEEEGEEEEEDADSDFDSEEADLGGDGDIEDRVMDLEDALEELKAEFEELLASEEHEEENQPGIHGDGEPMHDLDAEVHAGGEPGSAGPDELDSLMEYVNKVGGNTYNSFGKMGDDGANTKSIVAGKNDMGGTASNIAQSFSTTTGGTQGGLAKPTAGDLTSGLGTIQNRVDSKAGKTAFTKKEPGHGAEKAGSKETADNKQSVLKAIKK